MAYGNANLDSDYQTWAAADIPMMVGRNWLRTSGALARWRQSVWGIPDRADSDGPSTYGYDEHDHLQTYPSSTTYLQYIINFGSAIADVDCVILLNHNLNSVSASGVYIDFDANQDGNFSSSHTAASDTSLADDHRLAFLDLDHGAVGQPQLYSDVQYMRIRVTGASLVPKFGEVIIGQRTQLNHHPKTPYNDKQFISSRARFESDSGVIKDHVFYTGRRKLAATYTVHEDARITDIDDFWKTETDYGTLPFIWIDEPTTTPNDAYWMKFETPELMQPILGYAEREWTFSAIEQGPNFLSDGT